MDNANQQATATQPPSPQQSLPAIQETKRSHLPLILIILGILESIQPLTMIFTVIPRLSKLYQNLNISGYNPIMSYGLIGAIVLIALMQIIYGVMLMSKQKSTGSLIEIQKKVAKILLIIGVAVTVISAPIMIGYVITPIYKLTNDINHTPIISQPVK